MERERREKRLKQDVATAHSKLLDGIKVRTIKKWSLEDDDEDDNPPLSPSVLKDEESSNAGNGTREQQQEEEDEIDPLDAYMQVSGPSFVCAICLNGSTLKVLF